MLTQAERSNPHVFEQRVEGGWLFKARSAQDLYRCQLEALLRHGENVMVKGRPTLEALNVMTIITEPARRVHAVPGRRANPWLALSEALWLLASRNDVAALAPYNKRIADYSDDGETLYGAYGYRVRDQLPGLLARLRADPNDRRAVLSIWRSYDLDYDGKDPPCNNMVYFKLRGGRLHMTVLCRSNDIHWGLYGVNLCQFSVLQEYIAARLGVALGTQTHLSNSLHLYLDSESEKITARIRAAWREPLPELPAPRPLFPTGLPRHQEFVLDCGTVLNGHDYGNAGEPYGEGVAFLEFASDFLRWYRPRVDAWPLNTCRHTDYFGDWILAAERFSVDR